MRTWKLVVVLSCMTFSAIACGDDADDGDEQTNDGSGGDSGDGSEGAVGDGADGADGTPSDGSGDGAATDGADGAATDGAASDGDDGAATDGDDGGGALRCQESCDAALAAECPNNNPDCVTNCEKVYAQLAPCATEWAALIDCTADATFQCGDNGDPGTDECDDEDAAFSACTDAL